MDDDIMKQTHVDAFDFANEIAHAIDDTGGDDFKTAFVAALLADVKRKHLLVAPALDPDKPVKGKRKNAAAAPQARKPIVIHSYAVRTNWDPRKPLDQNVAASKKSRGRAAFTTTRTVQIPEGAMTTKEAALYCGMQQKTFENLRTHGNGPPGSNDSGRWLYTMDTLDAWVEARKAKVA
jgi:hypothetical protein